MLWPAQALRDLVFDLPLPALSWLLGHGQLKFLPAPNSQAWQAHVAGLEDLPAAALRVSAQGLDQTGRWLCLDPIHLRVERTQLVVEDPIGLKLEINEAATLIADLAPLLEELGELHLGSPHEWHLHLHSDAPIQTTALSDAIGLNADSLMPQTENVRSWRRILNEVQMTLHEHPVNVARSAHGLPTVNSLWPWGEGQLQTQAKPAWNHIQGDATLWQGLARHLGCPWQALPDAFSLVSGNTLVFYPALAAAAQHRDAMRWRHAMQQFETNWCVPLMQALQSGQLNEVVLHGHGSEQALTATVRRNDRWKFWRKPVPLTVLGVAL
ncbi:MAG TPA: hypothetical protein VL381_04040 [Rhodocyclaceae bacterium]|nr:hypothetical protein [Rhodocyclaceae bacterium]